MTSLFDRIIEPFLDILYPPDCVGCGVSGSLLCAACQAKMIYLKNPLCHICGYPKKQPEQVCQYCQSYTLSHINSVKSAVFYQDPIATAIHHFKYENGHALAPRLAQLLANCYHNNMMQTNVIVPVPLYKAREKERGYNQSTLLATHLSKIIQQPVNTKLLMRKRSTVQQISLKPAERKKNVEGAFIAKADQMVGQVVLLIDDVLTTGATLNACAQALKQKKASAVYGLTIARSILDKQIR